MPFVNDFLFLFTDSHFSKLRIDPTHPLQINILNDSTWASSHTFFLYCNPNQYIKMYLDGQIKVITSKQSALLDRSKAALKRDTGEAFLILTCHMPSTSELHTLLGTTENVSDQVTKLKQ